MAREKEGGREESWCLPSVSVEAIGWMNPARVRSTPNLPIDEVSEESTEYATNASSVKGRFTGRPKPEHATFHTTCHMTPAPHHSTTNWDEMKKIWHTRSATKLKVASEEHHLLNTEAPLNPKGHRERMMQTMYSKCSQCPPISWRWWQRCLCLP